MEEGPFVNLENAQRLFGLRHAFDHPLVLWATLCFALVLALTPFLARGLLAVGRIDGQNYADILARWRSWLWLTLLLLGPILLGAAWVMAGVLVLSLLCFREYARATGLFREKGIDLVVVAGIFVVAFAAFDHFERLFFASAALTCGLIVVATIPLDRPKGFIQRVALGVLGFVLFGYSLGYLSLLANRVGPPEPPNFDYRPLLMLILLAVKLNDGFAAFFGKMIGGPKLLPHTSPGKTVAGALAALLLTTAMVGFLGHWLFLGTAMDRPERLVTLGVMISGLGQLGALMLSAIKRDIGVSGTGGLLDQFDSLVLVPPAVYHYLSLTMGPLTGPSHRLFTGG
jgi:phosphatidate cytidylyltransferase